MELIQATSIEGAVKALFGEGVTVEEARGVPGGDINESYCLELSNGKQLFVKCNRSKDVGFFRTEAEGLNALRGTGTIGVPEALATGTDKARRVCFLVLEYLPRGKRIAEYWERFGRELAALHRAESSAYTPRGAGPYGFLANNYIGATPQKNAPRSSWVTFFRECRLEPQFRMASRYFDARARRRSVQLLDHLGDWLPEPEFPSLLHGDLWSGNAICGPDGKAWILDPAVYVGHYEAELAMTELFGGFPAPFYRAYREVNPIERGYAARRDLYNLYHLLNHLNLFGSGYLGSVERILRQYT